MFSSSIIVECKTMYKIVVVYVRQTDALLLFNLHFNINGTYNFKIYVKKLFNCIVNIECSFLLDFMFSNISRSLIRLHFS